MGIVNSSFFPLTNSYKIVKMCIRDSPERDQITIEGKPLRFQRHVYLMMNKPAGVVSASRDSREKTVVDLVPPALSRRDLFPAGRLDRDTTGLLILTDDGELAHRMLSPKKHVYKLYEASEMCIRDRNNRKSP